MKTHHRLLAKIIEQAGHSMYKTMGYHYPRNHFFDPYIPLNTIGEKGLASLIVIKLQRPLLHDFMIRSSAPRDYKKPQPKDVYSY